MPKVLTTLRERNMFASNEREYDDTINLFLSKYYICEAYGKELQKISIYEENRKHLQSHFNKLIGKNMTQELLKNIISSFNVSKLKSFNETQNNINVKNIRNNIPEEIFSHNKIDLIFHSNMINKNGKKIKTARILRNEIVHSLSLSAIKEVKERMDELIKTMDNFLKIFR